MFSQSACLTAWGGFISLTYCPMSASIVSLPYLPICLIKLHFVPLNQRLVVFFLNNAEEARYGLEILVSFGDYDLDIGVPLNCSFLYICW